MMTSWVALLRGINVAGRKPLRMAELRDCCADAGASDVVTYVQSGNVLFTHSVGSEGVLRAELEHRIAAAAGFDVTVMLRTAGEMAAISAANPYASGVGDHLHVGFMLQIPTPAATAKFAGIDRELFLPEAFSLVGREVFLSLPNGVGRAKLPRALAAVKAAPPMTLRNWRTVTKLVELCSSSGEVGAPQ